MYAGSSLSTAIKAFERMRFIDAPNSATAPSGTVIFSYRKVSAASMVRMLRMPIPPTAAPSNATATNPIINLPPIFIEPPVFDIS